MPLEMTSAESYLVVYDITNPALPTELGRTSLFGQPRDLLVIPTIPSSFPPRRNSLSHELVGGRRGDPRPGLAATLLDIKGQYL